MYFGKVKFLLGIGANSWQSCRLISFFIGNKVLYRLGLNHLRSRVFRFKLAIDDTKFPIQLRMKDTATFFEIFYDQVYNYDFKLPSHPVIVDAGGHIGMASIFLYYKYRLSSIITLEPHLGNYNILKTNIPFAKTKNLALSDSSGDLFLQEMEENANHRIGSNGKKVRCIDLGTLIQQEQIDRIHLLKIDIEGHESVVFQDIEDWIAYVDSIIIELHDTLTYKAYEEIVGNYGLVSRKLDNGLVVSSKTRSFL